MRSFQSMQAAADYAVEAGDGVCDWCSYQIGVNVAVPCELRAQLEPPTLIVSVICQDCAEAMKETIAICRGEGEPWTCPHCAATNHHPGGCWECGEKP